jgi:chromosomal replication initiation ATPase DnaA
MSTHSDPAVFMAAQRASLAQFVTAQVYNIPVADMRRPTRGRPIVARARQIAIHLANAVFAMTHRQLAVEFGRDRSTVQHACSQIERMREESAEFDATLRWMAMARNSPPANGCAAISRWRSWRRAWA